MPAAADDTGATSRRCRVFPDAGNSLCDTRGRRERRVCSQSRQSQRCGTNRCPKILDDLCVIRSMQNINGDHFSATPGIHTGSATFAHPSIGSWLSYGLGTESLNLPAFVVISPGLPYAGDQVWSADFLPAIHRGTRVIPRATSIANMHPQSSLEVQRTELDILNYFTYQHLQGRANDDQLTSRIQSFKTAAEMQLAAPEVFD